jgi:hypothetical protein
MACICNGAAAFLCALQPRLVSIAVSARERERERERGALGQGRSPATGGGYRPSRWPDHDVPLTSAGNLLDTISLRTVFFLSL